MGLIELEGMEFYAYHGCFREEQVIGNTFIVYVSIETDCDVAGQTDNLNDTVNYQRIYVMVKEEMAITSKLLERVARRILNRIYDEFEESVSKASIKISKMNPPMGGRMDCVSVTLSK